MACHQRVFLSAPFSKLLLYYSIHLAAQRNSVRCVSAWFDYVKYTLIDEMSWAVMLSSRDNTTSYAQRTLTFILSRQCILWLLRNYLQIAEFFQLQNLIQLRPTLYLKSIKFWWLFSSYFVSYKFYKFITIYALN
jgi:hypothetical protein